MAEPFLAEIRIMSFGFAPKGWALCNGQLLPINQNQALFSLLGTTYGGDGETTSRCPTCGGACRSTTAAATRSASGAARTRTRSSHPEMPAHTHVVNASNERRDRDHRHRRQLSRAVAGYLTLRPGDEPRRHEPRTLSNVGGSPAAPRTCSRSWRLNFCIALQGIFPSAELRRRDMAQPYVGEIRMFARQLRAGRLDVLRGPIAADLRERDAVQPDRHDLRRRRPEHFALPDLRGRVPLHAGTGTQDGFNYHRRDGRRGDRHADHPADPRAHAPAHRERLAGQPERAGRQHAVAGRDVDAYVTDGPFVPLATNAVGPTGAPAAQQLPAVPLHQFIISLFGIFPQQT